MSIQFNRVETALKAWQDACEGISQDAPLNSLRVFLTVASGAEGLSVNDMVERLDMSQSSASRNMRLLTEWQRPGRRGLSLCEWRVNPQDFRSKGMYLTEKGRELAKQFQGLLNQQQSLTALCA